MNRLLSCMIAMLFLALVEPRAQAESPAELFPPQTLAYAEIHDPAGVASEISAFIKGTILEDGIALIHQRRDSAKTMQEMLGKDDLGILTLITSPEMLAEIKKIRSVGVGITGFTENGDPIGAMAIVMGDSSGAAFAARAFLTMSSVRKVGAVSSVPIYQMRSPMFVFDPATGEQKLDNDKPLTDVAHQETYAYLPGLFVIGTSKSAVSEIISRYQKKESGSLAETPAFQEASKRHRQMGLFFFANVPGFRAKFEKSRGPGANADEFGPYAYFKLLAEARNIRYLTGSFRMRSGQFSLQATATYESGKTSPLLDLLDGATASPNFLKASNGTGCSLALNLPVKNRSTAVIGFLNAMVKATGELGRQPGDTVRELEEKYKLSINSEILAKTQSILVIVPAKQELPKGAREIPILVFECETTEAATAWEALLPKLVAEVGKVEPGEPSSEIIRGIKVMTLPGTNLPTRGPIHYARKNRTFTLGADRGLVAAATDAATTPLSVKEGTVPLIGSFRLDALLPLLQRLGYTSGLPNPAVAKKVIREDLEELDSNTPKVPSSLNKSWNELLKVLSTLPNGSIKGSKNGEEIRLEFSQTIPPAQIAPTTAAVVEWIESISGSGNDEMPVRRRIR